MSDRPLPFEAARGGVRVRVRLTPKAARDRIDGPWSDAEGTVVLKAGVTAVPEGGKANAALIRMLAKAWKVPKSTVSVVAGVTDRRKVLFVEGDTGALVSRLTQWMDNDNG